MMDRQWPELGIGSFWPMHSSMKHHRPGARHDSLNGSFGDSIVMVSSRSCIGKRLMKDL
jgi:hypothetical protein